MQLNLAVEGRPSLAYVEVSRSVVLSCQISPILKDNNQRRRHGTSPHEGRDSVGSKRYSIQ